MTLQMKNNKFIKKIPFFIQLPVILIGSWIFQGMRGMGLTEKIFKIFLEILLFIPIFSILFFYLNIIISIIFSFIISHSITYIIFGEKFVWMKNFGLMKTQIHRFHDYIERIRTNAFKEKSIYLIVACGSIARNEIKETSDLDIRVIRKKGLNNGIRVCLFVMKERLWALVNNFPLDIAILDDTSHFSEKDNPRVIIFNSEQTKDIIALNN